MASKLSSPHLTKSRHYRVLTNSSIASRIGLDLLEKGYTLRGTLRNYNHADALVNGAYNSWRDRVQIVIVSNMIVDGAFDEAVKGNPSPYGFRVTLCRPLLALFDRHSMSQPLISGFTKSSTRAFFNLYFPLHNHSDPRS